jgi:MFS family permease
MLAYFLAQLPAGALADRLRRRAVLLVADAVRALLVLVIGVGLVAHRPLPVWAVIVISVLGSLVSSVADPAGQAATRHLVAGDTMPAALALNTVRGQTIMLVAPLLGGILYKVWPALPFLIDALSYGVSFVMVHSVRQSLGGGRTGAPRSLIADITVGLRFVRNSRFLRAYLVWAALEDFSTAGMAFVLVLAVQPHGSAILGAALAFVSFGGLVGGGVATRSTRTSARSLLPSVTAAKVLLVGIMAVWPTPIVLAICLATVTFLGPTVSTAVNAHVFVVVPDNLMGRVQSSMTLVAGALYPFATLAAGWLTETTSPSGALAILGAMLASGLVAGLQLIGPHGLGQPAPPGRPETGRTLTQNA